MQLLYFFKYVQLTNQQKKVTNREVASAFQRLNIAVVMALLRICLENNLLHQEEVLLKIYI